MKKKWVQWVAVAMSAMLLGGCSVSGAGEEKQFPTYDTEESFYIAGWGGPYPSEADYALAKEAGINHFIVAEGYLPSGGFAAQHALDLNRSVGITGVLHIGNHYGSLLGKHETDYNDFTGYIDRVCYSDEPVYTDFGVLKQWAKEHDETYGDNFAYYVNLLSAGAHANELGDTIETQTFDNYVDSFCSEVLSEIKTGEKILSCDMYPIVQRNGKTSILTNWLYTLETMMYKAKAYKANHEEFVQVTEHPNGSLNYPRATEESIRYQVYVLLNFETSGFTYFTYSSPLADYKNSCVNIDKSQSLNDQYYYVKTVNAEIKAFENIYLNYSVDGVMPVYGTENDYDVNETTGEVLGNSVMRMMKKSVKTIDNVSSITATEDTLVSGMSDKDGNQAMLITNFSDPYEGLNDTLEIEFDKAAKYTRLAVYRKGVRKVYEIKNNKITLELESGEGIFVMPA